MKLEVEVAVALDVEGGELKYGAEADVGLPVDFITDSGEVGR